MKNLLFLLVLTILLNSCATTKKTTTEALHHAIVGQNEMIVYKRLGLPARTASASDGGKVMIYEFYSKGMYLTPNKSELTLTHSNAIPGNSDLPGITLRSNVNTGTNDPKYTVYPINVSYFKVYIDKHGNAVRIEQNMSQEQLDIYHERFKHFKDQD